MTTYTKREIQILKAVEKVEKKHSIRGNDEYTDSNYRETAKILKKKGIDFIEDSERKKLSKIGTMRITLYQLDRAMKGYI